MNHVVKRSKNARIVNPLAKPEADHCRDENAYSIGETDQNDKPGAGQQSRRLGEHRAAGQSARQAVCRDAGRRHAEGARQMDINCSAQARRCQLEMEFFFEKSRRPEQEDTRNGIRSDRKSTRLNSSHLVISYAVFCLKKKKTDDATC